MPRAPKVDSLTAIIQSLGEKIGAQLAAAISASLKTNARLPEPKNGATGKGKGRPGRKPAAGKACAVPTCGRKAISKGLCSNHYQKAHRLKMKTDKLSAGDLETLGQDARATRWKK